ncbi:MAG TPA: RHS repeat-associated core domain-containing protein, partial [bacterium]|nr:RHS repeat-associated core domain-containing protein [bacterium]
VWTKGDQVIGTVNSCQVLTLVNPKPQGGYFEVSFNSQPGYIPVNSAVVGIPTACLQSSTTSQTTSIMPQNSFVFFYHDDHLGSTGYLTDQNGALSEHIEYLPFGETWTQQDRGTQIFPDYEFSGKELDTETGLYYFGARYYDPRTSLWQSADPGLGDCLPNSEEDLGLPGEGGVYASQNLSLYSYAHDNPLILTDPDGESPKFILIGERMWRVHAMKDYLLERGVPKENIFVFRLRNPLVELFNTTQSAMARAKANRPEGSKMTKEERILYWKNLGGRVGGMEADREWTAMAIDRPEAVVLNVGKDKSRTDTSDYWAMEMRLIKNAKTEMIDFDADIEQDPRTFKGKVKSVGSMTQILLKRKGVSPVKKWKAVGVSKGVKLTSGR